MRAGRILFLSAATLLMTGGGGRGRTTPINSDPPDFPSGQTVTTPAGISFPDGPVVFDPTTATDTEPYALHNAQACNVNCTNNAYKLRINRPTNSQGGTTDVAMKVGISTGVGGDIPVDARLVAYSAPDGAGTLIADSGDAQVNNGSESSPITTPLAVHDAAGR